MNRRLPFEPRLDRGDYQRQVMALTVDEGPLLAGSVIHRRHVAESGVKSGVEDGAAASDLFAKERGNGTERGIFPQVGEAGKLARRSRLSDARPAMTHADIAVVRAGFGKLDELGMFAGRQERLLDQELNRQRRRAGALGRWWAGKPYPLGRHRRSPWGQAPACRAPSRRAGRAGSRATTGAQRARS